MEIKIDMNGSDIELATFLHSLTIITPRKTKRPLKRQIRRKKAARRKWRRRTQNQTRRMASWMIRKWPTSEHTFSGTVSRMEVIHHYDIKIIANLLVVEKLLERRWVKP